jgi:hypothetical protein
MNLEVQVGAGAAASTAHVGDQLTLLDGLTNPDG